MGNLTRYERVTQIIYHLRDVEPGRRTIAHMTRDLDMSYNTIRDIITKHYPWCFKNVEGYGWKITGVPPMEDVAFDFNYRPAKTAPIPTPAPVVKAEQPVEPGNTKNWTWNQNALRYLDQLWPGRNFETVLSDAYKSGKIDEIVIIGKTITYAAIQMRKNDGNTNFMRS